MHIKEVVMLWLGVGDGGESCCHAFVCDFDDIGGCSSGQFCCQWKYASTCPKRSLHM